MYFCDKITPFNEVGADYLLVVFEKILKEDLGEVG